MADDSEATELVDAFVHGFGLMVCILGFIATIGFVGCEIVSPMLAWMFGADRP